MGIKFWRNEYEKASELLDNVLAEFGLGSAKLILYGTGKITTDEITSAQKKLEREGYSPPSLCFLTADQAMLLWENNAPRLYASEILEEIEGFVSQQEDLSITLSEEAFQDLYKLGRAKARLTRIQGAASDQFKGKIIFKLPDGISIDEVEQAIKNLPKGQLGQIPWYTPAQTLLVKDNGKLEDWTPQVVEILAEKTAQSGQFCYNGSEVQQAIDQVNIEQENEKKMFDELKSLLIGKLPQMEMQNKKIALTPSEKVEPGFLVAAILAMQEPGGLSEKELQNLQVIYSQYPIELVSLFTSFLRLLSSLMPAITQGEKLSVFMTKASTN